MFMWRMKNMSRLKMWEAHRKSSRKVKSYTRSRNSWLKFLWRRELFISSRKATFRYVNANRKEIFMISTKNKAKLKFIVKKRLNFSIKSILKECDITTQKEQLNLINITREFSTTINILRQRFVLMIDSNEKRKNKFLNRVDRKEFSTQLYQHKHDSKVMKYSLN